MKKYIFPISGTLYSVHLSIALLCLFGRAYSDDSQNEYPVVDGNGFPSGFVLTGDQQQTGWLDSTSIVIDTTHYDDSVVTIDGTHYNQASLKRLGLILEKVSKPNDPTIPGGPTAGQITVTNIRNAIIVLGGVQGQALLSYIDSATANGLYGDIRLVDGGPPVNISTENPDFILDIQVNSGATNTWTIAQEILLQFYGKYYKSVVLNTNESAGVFKLAYLNILQPESSEIAPLMLSSVQAVEDPTDSVALNNVLKSIISIQRRAVTQQISQVLSITTGGNAGAAVVVNLILWKEDLIDPVQAILAGIPIPIQGLAVRLLVAGGRPLLTLTTPIAAAFAKTAAARIVDLAARAASFIEALKAITRSKAVEEMTSDERAAVGVMCSDICCFRGDQLVKTIHGTVKIQDLRIGDKLVSYNEGDNKNESGTVEHITIGYSDSFIDLSYVDQLGVPHDIETTYNHPFAVQDVNGKLEWVPAGFLHIGYSLIGITGNGTITGICSDPGDICYDIIVSGQHDYYIGEFPVLVHNGPCFNTIWLAFEKAAGAADPFAFMALYSDKWEAFIAMVAPETSNGIIVNDRAYALLKKAAYIPGFHEIFPRSGLQYIFRTFRSQADAAFAGKLLQFMNHSRILTSVVKFNEKISASWGAQEIGKRFQGFAKADNAIGKVPLGHATSETVCTEFSQAYHQDLMDAITKSISGGDGSRVFNVTTFEKLTMELNMRYFRNEGLGGVQRLDIINQLYTSEIYPFLENLFQ